MEWAWAMRSAGILPLVGFRDMSSIAREPLVGSLWFACLCRLRWVLSRSPRWLRRCRHPRCLAHAGDLRFGKTLKPRADARGFFVCQAALSAALAASRSARQRAALSLEIRTRVPTRNTTGL